jgi:hypothetical protein
LGIVVSTRSQLQYSFLIQCPYCARRNTYYSYEVFAETTAITSVGGAVVVGLIGLIIGGPLGGLLGALGGGVIGAGAEERDRAAVERFNRS